MSKTLNKRNDKQPYSEMCRQYEIQCTACKRAKKSWSLCYEKVLGKLHFIIKKTLNLEMY